LPFGYGFGLPPALMVAVGPNRRTLLNPGNTLKLLSTIAAFASGRRPQRASISGAWTSRPAHRDFEARKGGTVGDEAVDYPTSERFFCARVFVGPGSRVAGTAEALEHGGVASGHVGPAT